MVFYRQPPRRPNRRGDRPSVGAPTTAEGVFCLERCKSEYTPKGEICQFRMEIDLLRVVPSGALPYLQRI